MGSSEASKLPHFSKEPEPSSRISATRLKLMKDYDIDTRWNSTLLMCRQLCEQRRAVENFCFRYKRELGLDENEWLLLEDLVKLLAPFEYAMKQVCLSSSALSDQWAVGKTLMNKIRGIDKFLEAQQRMEKAIDEKFLRLEYNRIYGLATFLDARFKDRLSEDRTRFRQQVTSWIEQEAEDLIVDTGEHLLHFFIRKCLDLDSVEPPEKMSRPSFFDSLGIYDASVTKRPPTQLQLEINAYVLEECQQPDVDCMEYWKNNCKIFPSLASVARRFLSSPSTSVASEQLFSVARNVFHYRRFKLAPKNAEMLVFLNKVLPLLHYQY
uniref:HAT C-terminal dimerisation domain-containing protein n=1 Tax=Ditylenchus dipsaci TaxID=166011 RepID=A0A915DXG1_9BILA